MQELHKTLKTQKTLAGRAWNPLFPALLSYGILPVTLASGYTPESQWVLERVRDAVAVGRLDAEVYTEFSTRLETEDGCASWEELRSDRDPSPDSISDSDGDSLLTEWMREACPQSAPQGNHGVGHVREEIVPADNAPASARLRGRLGARPRAAGTEAPDFHGEAERGWARAALAWRGPAGSDSNSTWSGPYWRYAEVERDRGFVRLGHTGTGAGGTRLPFVAGSPFYAGWSGASGIDSPLGARFAGRDGLSAGLALGRWRGEIETAWNRLEPRTPQVTSMRRDAVLYAAGMAGTDWRVQAARQRCEPEREPESDPVGQGPGIATEDSPEAGSGATIDVLGFEAGSTKGWGRFGGAVSRSESQRENGRWGGYGEAAWGWDSRVLGDCRIQLRQATAGWANPLQAPQGYLRDILPEGFILPGRGEGGFTARSRLPLPPLFGVAQRIETGASAAWDSDRENLLAAGARLAWSLENGPWTCVNGFSARAQAARGIAPVAAEGTSGLGARSWGQSLAYARRGWRAEGAWLWRAEGYRGSRPHPVTFTLHRIAAGDDYFGVDLGLGDFLEPSRYASLSARQGWLLGNRTRLDHSLNLPWSGDSGWTGALGYQLALAVEF